MKEIWKDVPGYEGHYQVSNTGRVRSLTKKVQNSRWAGWARTVNGVILEPLPVRGGYLRVALHNGSGKKQYCSIHRLVMAAFVGSPGEFHVNHKNGDPADNRLENLEYVTPSQNEQHKRRTLKNQIGESHPQAKLTEKQVWQIRDLYKKGGISHRSIGREYGISHAQVGRIVRGKSWS